MPQRSEPTGPDLVLVTLDTFRADHLNAATPALAHLAASSAIYTQAVTTAPLTAPAHASMLTGLPPLAHGLYGNGGQLRAASVVPRLRQRGYATGAFLSAKVLDRATGLDAGFSTYDAPGEREGVQTLSAALAWWASAPPPRFLWVHLYDAHAPYAPEAFRPDEAALQAARERDREARRSLPLRDKLAKLAAGSGRNEEALLLYGGEVREVDALVGRLVEALPASAVLIVAGDHGEAFGEHGSTGHGGTLYEEALRVPLVVRGLGTPGVHDELVAVASVAGMLLGEAPAPAREVRCFTTGQETVREPGEELGRSVAVRLPHAKLVAHRGEDVVYFDLAKDPLELTPLPVPSEHASLGEELREAWRTAPVEALRALGYVSP